MEIRLDHAEGLRLRQQQAQKVERSVDGQVVQSVDWKFEGPDVGRNVDPRRRDHNGAPLQLPHYTAHISYGLKNLVVEKKGAIVTIPFRNSSLRNQIRIKQQAFVEIGKKDRAGHQIKEWKDQGAPVYVPANTFSGVSVGDGQRAILDEMPT